ncbi:LysR family transcriptional regulator [Candidatus Methylopumilus universalis]|uniref:LysR family transcriptional regulator n=1 Tax=Candidatus Methylopumilus universalis TaxID=2588536 RepID=A0AAX1F175_9PROT|nr:LysR family transcriptional regulator [Candidatus Methylopumilus universalis]QDC41671.1 LysR family transcriptional regulator [Candidatus Methylopumilus universalis]QDC42952.1 LysR family transcriptional regulator [Candidatus Methylopumilus universalis]QDC55341.1 LysR family transcriptional regulator [Candidatus Methylopumilus universalis]QDC56620.1 LysR family transcriptional regulator [Candidatus Methylopumilus universalis]QDC57911.1 LysR family transcriptional regulator [Candidatus Methy
MNITFRQLRLFLALEQTESVTKAARMMHITQPTASMQLKEMTENIGSPLFEVISKKIHLTGLGKEFAKTAREMMDRWEAFEQHATQMKGLTKGRLRVAVVSTAKYFVPKLLGSFCSKYPEVDISLEILNRDGVVRRVEDNSDDLYVMSRPPIHIDLEDQILMPNPLCMIAYKDHPLASKKNLRLQDLKHERFILRELGSGTRMSVDIHFKQKKFTPSLLLELGNNEAIKKAVASRLGVAVISIHALDQFDYDNEISVLKLQDFPINSQWHLVYLRGKQLSPIARAFHEHVLSESKHFYINSN